MEFRTTCKSICVLYCSEFLGNLFQLCSRGPSLIAMQIAVGGVCAQWQASSKGKDAILVASRTYLGCKWDDGARQ